MTPITYTVSAADGQTYGPHARETIQLWINEARIARESQVSRSDLQGWFNAADFQEFTWPAAVASAASVAPAPALVAQPATAAAARSGKLTIRDVDPLSLQGIRDAASWFWWIAGLSAVNFIIAVMGGQTSFAIGCLWASLFGFMAHGGSQETGDLGPLRLAGWVLGLLFIGFWGLMGAFARRAHLWAFILGMAVFAFDGFHALVATMWFSVAFHAYALWKLWDGVKDSWGLRKALKAGR